MTSSVTMERPRPFADDWQFNDTKDLSFSQRMLLLLGVLNPSPRHFTYPKPKGKVPVYVEYQQHARLFPIAALPVLARWSLMTYTSITIPPLAMYFFMVAYLTVFMLSFVQRMKKCALTYGFLDGEVLRDPIPESLSGKIFTRALGGPPAASHDCRAPRLRPTCKARAQPLASHSTRYIHDYCGLCLLLGPPWNT